jgi:hypothetical protein
MKKLEQNLFLTILRTFVKKYLRNLCEYTPRNLWKAHERYKAQVSCSLTNKY